MNHTLNKCRRLIVMAMCLAASPAVSGGATQGEERTIKKYKWRNEPVKISKLKIKGLPVGFGQKFNAEDDWVKGLTLRVKNTSDKPIVFVSFSIIFFEREVEGSGNLPLGMQVSYGRMPPAPGEPPVTDAPKPIFAGESVELVFTAEDYGLVQYAQKKFDYYPSKIKEVEVILSTIVFTDGKMWNSGGLMRRDPDDPRRWHPEENPQPPLSDFHRWAAPLHTALSNRWLSDREPPPLFTKISALRLTETNLSGASQTGGCWLKGERFDPPCSYGSTRIDSAGLRV